jgi:uncharacterized membrane protein
MEKKYRYILILIGSSKDQYQMKKLILLMVMVYSWLHFIVDTKQMRFITY